MTKRFLTSLVAIVLLVVCFAEQADAQPRWILGLRGGWSNASFYSGERRLGDGSRNGLNLGVAAELQLNEDFGVDFGVEYAQKGAEGTLTHVPDISGLPTLSVEGTAELDYIVLSSNVVIHLPTTQTTEARLFLGPGLGILARSQADGTVTSDGEPVEVDLDPVLSEFDVLITIGAAFGVQVNSLSVFLDFRTQFGVTNADEGNIDANLKTRSSALTLGVAIPLIE